MSALPQGCFPKQCGIPNGFYLNFGTELYIAVDRHLGFGFAIFVDILGSSIHFKFTIQCVDAVK